MMKAKKKPSARNLLIAKIHIAKKELALDDETYRNVLHTVTRKRSCRDLDMHQLQQVLNHMKSRGFKEKHKSNFEKYGTPKNINTHPESKMLKKINAILAENKLHWNYAHGIAKQMYYKDRVQLCDNKQIHAVLAALVLRDKKLNDEKKKGEKKWIMKSSPY